MTLTRPTVRAFRFIREIQLAYSQRTIQGVYKDLFVKDGKLHFTHDLSQIADGDFLWSDNPFGNVSDIDERDKHAVLEFSQCTRELANLAPIIDIILKDLSGKTAAVAIHTRPGPLPVRENTVHSTGAISSTDVANSHTFMYTSTLQDGRTSDIVMDLTGSQYGWPSTEGLQLWDSYFDQRAVSQVESIPLNEFRESFDKDVQMSYPRPKFWEKVFKAERIVLHHAQMGLEDWLAEEGLGMKAFLELPDAEFETDFARLVGVVVENVDRGVESCMREGKYVVSKDAAGILEFAV
ncbi:hypothetical protein EG328_005689 [Venturia inaequalis]|uniref:Uncharacterized protein n=1 Tax=Venturia inaequalis TaxID=5025 RepID=A0A8H3VSY5_VENIN|nr:hypothetical protein EG328_005689 [Venturia inaequalis]KAE9994844.1 hypothetical protein EG327_000058 [Venturia inaequalis]